MTRIKRHLLASTVLLGAGSVAMPATADVFVFADIFKEKDKFVFEEIDKFKFVDVFVDGDFFFSDAAEAEALANQRNEFQDVEAHDNFVTTDISDSVNGNEGVTEVNQDAGNNVNQANIVSVAVDGTFGTDLSDGSAAFAEAQASAEQVNFDNFVFQEFETRDASIVESVNDNVGATLVNQNVGNNNNQLNSLAVAAADSAWVALSEADLGQFNDDNKSDRFSSGVFRSDTLADSVNGNTGVTAVNQSAGNMNNQATVISVSGASAL